MNGQPSLRRYLDLQAQLAEHDQAIGHLELQKAQHSTPPWDIESELLRRRAQKKQIMQELDDLAAAAIEPPPATRKPATRNPPGRPTKLNEEMIRAIAHAARSGLWKKDLCALVGIHPASLNAWLEIGEAEAERMAQGEPLNPDNALQFKLYLATRQAEAESKRARLDSASACLVAK